MPQRLHFLKYMFKLDIHTNNKIKITARVLKLNITLFKSLQIKIKKI